MTPEAWAEREWRNFLAKNPGAAKYTRDMADLLDLALDRGRILTLAQAYEKARLAAKVRWPK